MLFGSEPFGSTVLGASGTSYAEPSPFALLLRTPYSEHVVLAEFTFYDPDTTGEVTYYVGSPAKSFSSQLYGPALTAELVFRQSLIGDSLGPGETMRGSVSTGDLKISNPLTRPHLRDNEDEAAGFWDAIAQDYPDGRSVRVLLGKPDFDLDEYGEIFNGKIEYVTWDEKEIRVAVRSPEIILDQPVSTDTYAGTGGLDGGSDLKDANVPICIGAPKLIEPIKIDRGWDIYQIHGDSVAAQTLVYDGLYPFEYDGGVGDLYTWTPVPGHYVSLNASGLFRLGNPPARTVTCSPQGDNAGALGYVSALGDVCQRLLTYEGDVTDSDLELSSFSLANALYPGPFGVYTGTSSISRRQIVDQELLAPLLCGLIYTREGKIAIGFLRDVPSTTTIVKDDVQGYPKSLQTRPPYWRHRIGHSRAFTVATAEQVAGAADPTLRDFAEQEYRYEKVEDTDVQTRHLLSTVREVQTGLQSSTAAASEAARSLEILGVDRVQYEITVKNHQFQLAAGNRVNFVWPRWGLSDGKLFWVLDVEEDTQKRTTKLRLWG